MERYWGLLIICLVLFGEESYSITIPDLPKTSNRIIGDVNLGVIIPVHHHSVTDFCSADVRDLGTLQRVEAISQVKCHILT